MKPASYVVVIPTIGRPCLQACLDALSDAIKAATGPDGLAQVVLADDRKHTPDPLPLRLPGPLTDRTKIVTLEGRGAAAARNGGLDGGVGGRRVVFLDDDVQVGRDWAD